MNQYKEAKETLRYFIKKTTNLDDEVIINMVEEIPLNSYKKNAVLLHQGDEPNMSYYVITGCVRQYLSDENGKEATVDFFTENDAINMFSFSDDEGQSKYSLSCIEDTVLVECPHIESVVDEDDPPEVAKMIQGIFSQQFIELQSRFADFKLQSPEERFKALIKKRPDLIKRVPQHLLANYLNITPETFSRFKKRFM